MTKETHRTQADETNGGSSTGILDVLLAELAGDDGTGKKSLRRALEVEQTATTADLARIEEALGTLQADIDERKAAEAELRARIENNLEPRLDTVDRRLRELEERMRTLESETRGLRSELAGVSDSLGEPRSADADNLDDLDDLADDLDDLADDLDDLERTVATAFDTVTSDLESDLGRIQATLREDIDALERRLSTLEEAAGIGPGAETDDDQLTKY
ncbi:hypothetical protein [Natrinema salaciae]|uniref:Uncharacterized protein n=1 Tax=Natrinema salaciae TaxID=1186196 RepID=A0A1H9H2E6_9EURY|nr:hypothetical protein [Natrinema salaciae]SEQ56511.1 hypothetical protein SAMN04489841_2072 [Natrinema salaciae]